MKSNREKEKERQPKKVEETKRDASSRGGARWNERVSEQTWRGRYMRGRGRTAMTEQVRGVGYRIGEGVDTRKTRRKVVVGSSSTHSTPWKSVRAQARRSGQKEERE